MIQLADHIRGQSIRTVPASIRHGVPKGVRLTGAPLYWARGSCGSGIRIGTIDTGVAAGHPDLLRTTDGKPKIAGFRDYVNSDGRRQPGSASYDDNGHGTHVAGTMTANGALQGVAPGAELMVYKVLSWRGTGTDDSLTQAIRDAVADGCRIISMSLGSDIRVLAWTEAIQAAVAAGLAVPVSAGNEGPGAIAWPANENEVISVAAAMSDLSDGWRSAWFSNSNSGVDLIAHGVDVLSCAPDGGYAYMSGTSMAQPHVAGMLALLIEDGELGLQARMSEPAIWEGIKTRAIRLPNLTREQAGAGLATFYPSLPRARRVQLTIGQTQRVVDGHIESIDVAPITLQVDDQGGERTMTPPRHSHEPMGDQVDWNGQTRTVTITRTIIPGMEV